MILGEMCVLSLIYSYVAICTFYTVRCLSHNYLLLFIIAQLCFNIFIFFCFFYIFCLFCLVCVFLYCCVHCFSFCAVAFPFLHKTTNHCHRVASSSSSSSSSTATMIRRRLLNVNFRVHCLSC